MDKNILLNVSSKLELKLKLTAVFADKVPHELIAKEKNKLTLISEDKTYYLYLGDSKGLTRNDVYNFFVNFSSNNSQDLDIDVKSFVTSNLNESILLQTIYEALWFGTFKEYTLKSKKNEEKKVKYNVVSTAKFPSYTSQQQIEIQGESINLARNLQDMPPNLLYPEVFAKKIQDAAKGIKNLSVKVLGQKEITELNMNLLLAVNAGSNFDACVVVLEYKGDPQHADDILGLVGKGITFDSGGYSLKPSSAMKGMKFDMSGAASVCNAAIAAAKLQLKINFVAVACLTENKIGGHATLVETVFTSMNGKTVEINNTDAEGRLVLADGMTYALRKGKANRIIELSTLTGAMLVALGSYMTGAFATDDKLFNDFDLSSQQTNEEIWRMPIHQQNILNMRSSKIADLSNLSKDPYGGSSNAAAFLKEFSEDRPFLHLDIAGTAYKNDRGTGILIKTLVQYMKNYSTSK